MSGHGHVYPNQDGSKARCGGPGICGVCSAEAAVKAAAQQITIDNPSYAEYLSQQNHKSLTADDVRRIFDQQMQKEIGFKLRLSTDDVRRIVREEIEASNKPAVRSAADLLRIEQLESALIEIKFECDGVEGRFSERIRQIALDALIGGKQ